MKTVDCSFIDRGFSEDGSYIDRGFRRKFPQNSVTPTIMAKQEKAICNFIVVA